MERNVEFVSAVKLVGDTEELNRKFADYLNNYNLRAFLVQGDLQSKDYGHDFVKSGLVLPDNGLEVFDVDGGYPLELGYHNITLENRTSVSDDFVPGQCDVSVYVHETARHSDSDKTISASFDGIAFAEAIGVSYEVVEKGRLNDAGQFELTYSTLRPDKVVSRSNEEIPEVVFDDLRPASKDKANVRRS